MLKKKGKADRKVGKTARHGSGTFRHARGVPVIKRGVPQPGITKKEFMDILAKAAPPVEHESESDSEKSGTWAFRPYDGCNGKNTH